MAPANRGTAGLLVAAACPTCLPANFPGRWTWGWLTSGESHAYAPHVPENSELPVLAGTESLGYSKFRHWSRSGTMATDTSAASSRKASTY